MEQHARCLMVEPEGFVGQHEDKGDATTTAREESELGVSPDEAWKLVGDFVGFIAAMGLPVESAGEGIGALRTISSGSEPVVERLEERDENAKRIVYSIVSGPLPVVNYRSTIALAAAGEGRSALTWTGSFEPAPGVSEEKAVSFVRAVYRSGIAELHCRFGA